MRSLPKLRSALGRTYNLLTGGEFASPQVSANLLEDLEVPSAVLDDDPGPRTPPRFDTAVLAELDHRSDRPGWQALSVSARRALLLGTYDTMVQDRRRNRRRALALFGLWLSMLTVSQMFLPPSDTNPLGFAAVLLVRSGSTVLAGSALSNFLLLRVGHRVRLHAGFAGYRSFGAVTTREQFEHLADRCLTADHLPTTLDELVPRVSLANEPCPSPGVRFARTWLERNHPAHLPARTVRNAVLFEAGLAKWVADQAGEENLAVVLRLARRHPGSLADLLNLVRRL